MIDWSTVSDEAYPVPGATDAEIKRFVTRVGRPLSAAEIAYVNRGQRNPFPKGNPLYDAYRRFDPSLWTVPRGPLPDAYLSLLRWSNGGEFRTGRRWFQFFPALDPGGGVRAMLLGYNLPEYMPGALPVAFNGAGTFYLLDMRHPPVGGEYPVLCSRAGSLRYGTDTCLRVADSFLAACQGTIDPEELRFPDR